ncbi:cytochrome-c peroxidase [Crocinitomix algicola]|uniref:cytochrome-c peroxidase n=1 Tax=Crocinitomix algicola TaxID=1740263 RepID=UPI00083134A9|nr:cytochrome c peroxidase [Crocinitomix algicola]
MNFLKNTFFILTLVLSCSVVASEKPAQQLKKHFQSSFDSLLIETSELNKIINQPTINWPNIKQQFFNTRIVYKELELFIEYFDQEFVKDHINGAPLLAIERKAPDLVILEPSGFQIMEEVLLEENLEEFKNLAFNLEKKLKIYGDRIPKMRVSERMVFEAMREELIRLTALGITGFDTPSTENTVHENKAVLRGLHRTIEAYETYLDPDLILIIDSIFVRGNSYLKSVDFNTLNRFEFIRTFVNPLYELLLKVQIKLNIHTRDLGRKREYSVNYATTSIFDTDFLNYKYFSKYSAAGIEDERKELGKLLFFDPILSKNNQRACASCHHPDKAFSDGLKTSIAFNEEGNLKRNSPGLINSVFTTRFFWDVRAGAPEDQIEHVLFNPKEFNTNYDEIVEKIKSCDTYIDKFKSSYPENIKNEQPLINRYTIVASIGAYLQSLRSYNSEFDQAIKADQETSNKALVNGFNLFAGKAKCATCHFIPTFAGNVPPLFVDTETEVLGIPDTNVQSIAKLDDDKGRYGNGRRAEHAEHHKFGFKTVTLRNIALTAPYMHNGVFPTLREVVDFYNVGGGHGWGIAPENATLPPDSLHLSEKEIDDLILFMEALTDTIGLTSRPAKLPNSNQLELEGRTIGGRY